MTDQPTELAVAELRAAQARRRLQTTVGELQTRLNPRSIVSEAGDALSEGGSRALKAGGAAVRANPGKVAGAVALVAVIAGRKPIGRLVRRLRGRR